jgi:hypothetical protein
LTSGTTCKIELGYDDPTAIGDCGYLWAEGADPVGNVRYGYLETAEDDWWWVFISSELQVDWTPVRGTPYMYRTILTDPINVIEIREADRG